MTHDMARLSLNWSGVKQEWLVAGWPSPVSLPFLLDLHTEVTGSWKNPYSACVVTSAQMNYSNAEGLCMQGYVRMPRVEENLVSPHPVLLSNPRQTTLRLLGKACLEGLLEDLDHGEGLSPEAVKELCTCRAFRGVIRPSSLTTFWTFRHCHWDGGEVNRGESTANCLKEVHSSPDLAHPPQALDLYKWSFVG